jgi:hypothetical protein
MKTFNTVTTRKEESMWKRGRANNDLTRTGTGQNFDPWEGASASRMASSCARNRLDTLVVLAITAIPRLNFLQSDTLEAVATTRSDRLLHPTTLIPF